MQINSYIFTPVWSAWNQLNREMHPKKQPPRSFVTFDEIDLGSITIQGEPQLVRGEDALFFCNAVTSLPPSMLHYEWSFERDRPSQLASHPVKTYEGFSFSVQKASRKNMGKLQCSGNVFCLQVKTFTMFILKTRTKSNRACQWQPNQVHVKPRSFVLWRKCRSSNGRSVVDDWWGWQCCLGRDNVSVYVNWSDNGHRFHHHPVCRLHYLFHQQEVRQSKQQNWYVEMFHFRRNASRSPPIPTTNVPTSPTASNRTETSYTSDPQVYLKINPSTPGGPAYSDESEFSL